MSELTEKEKLMLVRLEKLIYTKGVSREFLVQVFELSGTYANIQTISNYAKQNNMSYNGVKNYRNIIELFDTKFVIDVE